MADVHKDQMIWLEDPQPFLPVSDRKNQKVSRLASHSTCIRVDKWVEQQPQSAWKPLKLRMSTKGWLKVDVLHARVWLWNGLENEARCWHLIVRREKKSPTKIKYSLCNAPLETTPERLAFMQGQRFWVERSFQDGKSYCGMADYQVRLWSGWHHHRAMVMIAMLFMLEERLLHRSCPRAWCKSGRPCWSPPALIAGCYAAAMAGSASGLSLNGTMVSSVM